MQLVSSLVELGQRCDRFAKSPKRRNVSGDRDTPKALSDRIVTIQGTPEQIEIACREVIRIVHRSQELDDTEDGIFVTVVPCGAVEHVVGPGGDTIRELVETIGAEVNISRNGIIGTELQPVSVAGTPKQMLEATMKVLGLVQELADKGGLTIDSYSWPRRADDGWIWMASWPLIPGSEKIIPRTSGGPFRERGHPGPSGAQRVAPMDVKNEKMEVMTRWALVAFGVVVLLRLKFVLFAAALPILAYWHYSGADKNEDQQEDAQAPADEEDDKEDFEPEEEPRNRPSCVSHGILWH
eukprot:s2676_g16.t1